MNCVALLKVELLVSHTCLRYLISASNCFFTDGGKALLMQQKKASKPFISYFDLCESVTCRKHRAMLTQGHERACMWILDHAEGKSISEVKRFALEAQDFGGSFSAGRICWCKQIPPKKSHVFVPSLRLDRGWLLAMSDFWTFVWNQICFEKQTICETLKALTFYGRSMPSQASCGRVIAALFQTTCKDSHY